MYRNFSGRTADETWLQIAEALRDGAGVSDQPSRLGPTREILHGTISIENPAARWVISRQPAINPAYAFAELIWTMNGRDDSVFVNYFNSMLPKLAGDGPTYHGAYGKRLCAHLGVDQFFRAYQALKNVPDSRQVVLQIWDGKIDLPAEDGRPVAPDIPCSLVSLLKVRNGHLEWTQVMRSNDIFRGIPYDFVLFTFMQEILAGWLGVRPGTYFHLSDSLHAYCDDLSKFASARTIEAETECAMLSAPFEESAAIFQTLAGAVEQVIDPASSPASILEALLSSQLPKAYNNMLAVLIAEGLRKRGDSERCSQAIAACASPLYRQLWARWLERYPVRESELGSDFTLTS